MEFSFVIEALKNSPTRLSRNTFAASNHNPPTYLADNRYHQEMFSTEGKKWERERKYG